MAETIDSSVLAPSVSAPPESELLPVLAFPLEAHDGVTIMTVYFSCDYLLATPPPPLNRMAASCDCLALVATPDAFEFLHYLKRSHEGDNASRDFPFISSYVHDLTVDFDACCLGHLSMDVINNYIRAAVFTIGTLPFPRSITAFACEYNAELLDALTMSNASSFRLHGYLNDTDVVVGTLRRRYADLETLSLQITGDLTVNPGGQNMLGYLNEPGMSNWNGEYSSPPSTLRELPFLSELLVACCSSLEYLTLDMAMALNFRYCSFDLPFLVLQRLVLKGLAFLDQTALGSLLGPSLTMLQIGIDDVVTVQCLDNSARGMLNLQMLVVTGVSCGGPHILDTLLLQARDLDSVACISPNSDEFNKRVIECLAERPGLGGRTDRGERRHAVVRLSLNWDQDSIPRQSLMMIAKLSQLQVLHLKANGPDCQSTWFVYHKAMRSTLAPLRGSLRRLMFSSDAYKSMPRWVSPCVFHDQCLGQPGPVTYLNGGQEVADVAAVTAAWKSHSFIMFKEAVAYFKTFPALEFLHIGRCMFKRGRNADGSPSVKFVGDTIHEMGFYDDMNNDFKIEV